jgi:hypothetical protein
MRWSLLISAMFSLALVVVLLAMGLLSDRHTASPDLRNGQVFIQDNLWSTGAYQYAVWVGGDGTPYVGRRPRAGGEWEVTNLAKLGKNPLASPTVDDEHNVYAIAVDSKGGVHVAGNMHGSPLRYVRAAPGSLKRWTTRPAPARGSSVTYPAFTALPDGTLLFWRRDGRAGRGAVRLDALDPGVSAWRSLGVVLDGVRGGESPYLHHVAVDQGSGVIHLLFEWRSGLGVETTNDVGYARSADGGRTWRRSDGTLIGSTITHKAAETVIDTPPSGSGLINSGGLTVDALGRPHGVVAFERPRGERILEHVWLEQGVWQHRRLADIGDRRQLAGTPDGRVWLLGTRGDALEVVDITPNRRRLPSRRLARVPMGWEVSYDSQALARDGTLEMLIPKADRPHVVEVRLADRRQ